MFDSLPSLIEISQQARSFCSDCSVIKTMKEAGFQPLKSPSGERMFRVRDVQQVFGSD